MTYDEVIARFENPQRNGRGVKVRCPCHNDKKNSLSISQADSGKILIKCQAGCDTKTVIEAANLNWRDLTNGNSSQSKNDPVIARYVYVDEAQKPLYRACRTSSKNFFQERFDIASGRFIPGMNGTRRVLYHLPEIVTAETVYITEGEKDADKLTTLALAATTNIGGAGKWDQSYSQSLKEKHVVILPDNDDPGREHGLLVARSVLPLAKSVKLISLPDLPQKGDVSDYLSSHSKEDLLALLEAAAPFTGAIDGKGQASLWPEFLTAKEILQAPKDPTRWIVADCLPVGSASVLVAKPKVGKSTIAADLAISVSRGEPFLGRGTQQSPVAYVFLDGPLTDIADTFVSLGLRETDPVFIHAGSAPADAIAWILAAVKDKGARLVIIDVLQKLCRFTDINDYSEVSSKMEPLLEAARDGNCHVLTLHHAKKECRDDLDAAIGSTAIRGLCYSYLFAKRLPESTRRIISSDQRGGKNFEEMGVGFDKATGRLKIEGTLIEVEVQEAEPKILELIAEEGGEMTERQIGQSMPIRALIISKALRKLYRDGKIERTGKGRRNSPFLYSIAGSLLDETVTPGTHSHVTTSYSLPLKGADNSGREKRETGMVSQGTESAKEILFPDNRESNRKRKEENQNQGISGRETDPWESERLG